MKRLLWATLLLILALSVHMITDQYRPSANRADVSTDPWWALVVDVWLTGALFAFGTLVFLSGKDQLNAGNSSQFGRLRSGARIFFLSIGVLFFYPGISFILRGRTNTLGDMAVYMGLCVIGVYILLMALLAKVEFDDEKLSATTFLLLRRRHLWQDLVAVEPSPDLGFTLLRFSGRGRAVIFHSYQSASKVVEYAKEVLKRA